jgi:hypothetical protein
MPKATAHYNLLVTNPDLVKEWHPTKNIGLKPVDVTPGSSRKIWWLCSSGHEWQAAVYSRTRGSGCPLCRRPEKTFPRFLAQEHPELIRDWHPTKNGALNPRNLPSGHLKKVWWVCAAGHEWKDTIKNRVKGKGCPACESSRVRKRSRRVGGGAHRPAKPLSPAGPISGQATVFFEKDFVAAYPGNELRNGVRYPLKATAILEDKASGHWMYAQMNNFSSDGMYFETEAALSPGTRIIIKFDKPIFPNAAKKLISIVRWCRELTDDQGTIASFGLGVEFIQPKPATQ